MTVGAGPFRPAIVASDRDDEVEGERLARGGRGRVVGQGVRGRGVAGEEMGRKVECRVGWG